MGKVGGDAGAWGSASITGGRQTRDQLEPASTVCAPQNGGAQSKGGVWRIAGILARQSGPALLHARRGAGAIQPADVRSQALLALHAGPARRKLKGVAKRDTLATFFKRVANQRGASGWRQAAALAPVHQGFSRMWNVPARQRGEVRFEIQLCRQI